VGLSETLALEGRDYGLRVTVICPNYTRTPMISGKSPIEERFPWMSKYLNRMYRDPDVLASRVVEAIKKDRLFYIDSLSARFMYGFHLISRSAFVKFNAVAYRKLVHLFMPQIKPSQ